MREELNVAEARLTGSRAEHEAAIQDLRVANEELQSVNEEYRSTSEELETSKEELQSMNEELQTVNSELKSKLETIGAAHSDLENIIAATDIGTLFLDPKMRIRMFTPRVARLFNITEADIGRTISDFTHQLNYGALADDAKRVLSDLAPLEREVEGRDGRWHVMRIRPYRTIDNRIDGVVVTFIDMTEQRQALAQVRKSEEQYRALFDTMGEGLLFAEVMRDEAGAAVDVRYAEANPAAIGMTQADFTGRRLSEVAPEFGADWREIPARVLATGKSERHEMQAAPLGRWFDTLFWKVPPDEERVAILLRDITERRKWEEAQRLLVGELNHRVKNMLAVVQSVAQQTKRGSETIDEFTETLGHRIQALANAHSVLTRRNWVSADLRELVEQAAATFIPTGDGERIHIEGPRLSLRPDVTISFMMAVYELGTNAMKYGALTVPNGRVEVTWSIDPDRSRVRFDWIESDGPLVEPPSRKGFGTRLLEKGIARELEGSAELDYAPAGLRLRLEFPLHAAIAI